MLIGDDSECAIAEGPSSQWLRYLFAKLAYNANLQDTKPSVMAILNMTAARGKAGHLRFAVLQCGSKSYFQVYPAKKITHFWE